MASGAGHGLEDADLERAAGGIGLHECSLGRLGPGTKRPGTLVADQQARSRGNFDAADRPLPDSEVSDLDEENGDQQGACDPAQGFRSKGVHGLFSSEVASGNGSDREGDCPGRLAAAGPAGRDRDVDV